MYVYTCYCFEVKAPPEGKSDDTKDAFCENLQWLEVKFIQ
jgi:hypothetical protein